MVRKVRKLNVGLKSKRQEMWSRMQDDARETVRVAKRPIKKDAGGNIDVNDAVRNAGGVVWNALLTAVDFDSALLLWLMHKFVQVGLDNKAIDWLEKKYANQKMKKGKDGKDKKLKKFTKNSPRLSSYLTYWLLLGMLLGGGYKGYQKSGLEEKIKDKIENIKAKHPQHKEGKEQEDAVKVYDVNSNSFRQDVVDQNWSEIVIGLLEFETYRGANPKPQSKEARQTYGPGITWVYENGKQNPCNGVYVDKVKKFSDQEIWDQVRKHCMFSSEVLGVAQRTLKKEGFDVVTDYQILGLLFAGYQIPASLAYPFAPKLDKKGNKIKDEKGNIVQERIPGIIPKLHKAGSDTQKIVDAFMADRDVGDTWHDGTMKRRWWCAMYYIGKISAVDFLSMDRDAFSKIDLNTIIKNGHFVFDDWTIDYALNLKKPGTGSVHDFLASHSALKDIESNLGRTVKHSEQEQTQKTKNPSMEQMLVGLKVYESGDYKKATAAYEKAIELDKDNMEAYSSLALAYKKLGDQTHSLDDYEKSLQAVRDCNARMNANKSLLYDADVKGATYFNAGLAHEEMAKLEAKAGNIESARNHYGLAKKNFVTSKDNAEKVQNTGRITTCENAIKRMDDAIKSLQGNSKVTGFNKGIKKVKEKQLSQSLITKRTNDEQKA